MCCVGFARYCGKMYSRHLGLEFGNVAFGEEGITGVPGANLTEG